MLHHQPFTRSATIFGDRVHLVGEENILSEVKVAKFLKEKELNYEYIRETRPSLEDIFVSLLGEKNNSVLNRIKNKNFPPSHPNNPLK